MNWITPYRIGPEDRPHIRALHMALVAELYKRGRVPGLILFGATTLLFALFKDAVAASAGVRVLFTALVLVLFLRVFLSLQGDRLQGRNHRLFPRFTLYCSGVLAAGLLLGGLGLAAFRFLEPGLLFLLCLCYLGITAVAAVSMAGSPTCFAALSVPILGSLILGGMLNPPFGLGSLFSLTVLVGLGAFTYSAYYVHVALCRNVLLGQRLGDLALRDPLTGLRNRRYLQEFMHEESPRVLRRWLEPDSEIRNRRSISIIMVDLDLFKQVNDQFGHAAGDAVLVQVAQLLREVVRKPDLVLRWGGEEFLILALDSDRSVPPATAMRVRERFAQHAFILPGGQTHRQTCSVGFAIFPFHPQRPDGLLWEQVFRMADESLYIAKENGRNRIQGILPGEGDPDAVVAAMSLAEPGFGQAAQAGIIQIL